MGYKDYLKEATKKLDIIDIHAFNFSKLYSEFNRKYFKNELPMLPILLGKLKNVGGKTKFTYNRSTGEIQMVSIIMSSFIETTKERIYGIMMHEMIHVWVVYISRDPYDSHGPKFTSKLKELRKKTPFDIPLTDNTEGLEVSTNVKTKTLYVVLQTYENKVKGYKYGIMVVGNPIKKSELHLLKKYMWPKDRKVEYYISTERQLLKYSIRRNANKLSFELISDDFCDLIKKTGKYQESIFPSDSTNKEVDKSYVILKRSRIRTSRNKVSYKYNIALLDKKLTPSEITSIPKKYGWGLYDDVYYIQVPLYDEIKVSITKNASKSINFTDIDKNTFKTLYGAGTYLNSLSI